MCNHVSTDGEYYYADKEHAHFTRNKQLIIISLKMVDPTSSRTKCYDMIAVTSVKHSF